MSFLSRKEFVEEGDTVILFFTVHSSAAIEICKTMKNKHGLNVENFHQSPYGQIRVMDLIGAKYGSKWTLSSGFAHILHSTCELWTKTLPHRTQIIYTPDISLILFGLDLRPGNTVLEAGTGSGSLSHAIIRTVAPTGHLFTFDFHEKRAELAKDDFKKHGLDKWVSVDERDVVSDGFPIKDNSVDAIFLDLPSPWLVISHAQNSLKRGGKICTFSPCIEQVQKTCEELRSSKSFIMIKTQESLQRPLSVQTKLMNSLDFTRIEPIKGVKLEPIKKNQIKFRTTQPPQQVTGHSGYLTFATFIPKDS